MPLARNILPAPPTSPKVTHPSHSSIASPHSLNLCPPKGTSTLPQASFIQPWEHLSSHLYHWIFLF
jgi:hypothetical protein